MSADSDSNAVKTETTVSAVPACPDSAESGSSKDESSKALSANPLAKDAAPTESDEDIQSDSDDQEMIDQNPLKTKSSRSNIRLILIGLVVVIVLVVIFMRGDQLTQLIDTIKKGTPIFIVLAVCSQLCKYGSQGFAYIFCFRSVNENFKFRESIKLVFGTFFLNTIAPSFNLAGITLVVDDASKREIPTGRATSAALLMQVTIDSGFVIIMLIGFGVLSFTVGLQPGWFLVGLLAIVLVGSLVCIMIIGGVRPDLIIRVLTPIERLVDKVLKRFKRGPIDGWVDKTIKSFSEAAHLILKNPKQTVMAFVCSIIASTFELGCFSFVGVSFGVHAIEPLVCGYVVATLFAMISFVPQGIGIVEAAVLVAFTLFSISQATALSIVLVYRGIVFWLPFLVGAVLIQRTKAFRSTGRSRKEKAKS
ncbi:MAG: flippase-like domain-containing protein [Eggerthellaceae bacterium]|nr:flippase-like domain-containing protein [Eggerthellaceae bacterium]